MATIKKYLSPKVVNGAAEIFFRVSISREKVFRIKTGVRIKPSRFKDGSISYPRANQKEIAELRAIDNEVSEIERLVLDSIVGVEDVGRGYIEEIIDRHHHPEKYSDIEFPTRTIYDYWEDFLAARDLSENRTNAYRSIARSLHRYEMYRRASREPCFEMDVDSLTSDDMMDFEQFYRNEWKLYDEYPDIYIQYPVELRPQRKSHKPQRRGDNMVVNVIKKIRAFYNWMYAQGLTSNRPFDKYMGNKSERYGTPYYLTIEERDRLADYDLSSRPQLAIQRDIFVFQCLVGCRVSDLQELTKSNVIGDTLEYVAAKTIKERNSVIRVPLAAKARALIDKYSSIEGERLFPFISPQKYNDAIKEMCKVCGINRVVTVINPTTGKDERKPICEVASSHLARRTFIGNLYKRVKDPNLVGSLSGHKEGSKAFTRYRNIDDDMKRELIDLIE